MVDGYSISDPSLANPHTDFASISQAQEIVTLKRYYSSTVLVAFERIYVISNIKSQR